MLRKLLSYFMVLLAIVITAVFYIWFDLEGILWDRQEQAEITASQIKKEKGTDYTGKKAGKGIKELKTKKQWDKLTKETGYATVVPEKIESTGVYSLAKWAEHDTKKTNGSAGRRKEEAVKPPFDYSAEYSPFYIIKLKDGTKILAQMNRGIAKKIAKGNEVKLPIGRKTGITDKAKEYLKEQCEKEKVSMKYVFYTIDNEWEKKNEDAVFWGKIGITIFVFIFLAIILQILERGLARMLFKPGRKEELREKVEELSDEEDRFYKEKEEDFDDDI